MHDFDTDDVKAIAIAPADKGGSIYAIANSYKGPSGLRLGQARSRVWAPPPPRPRPAKPGQG